MQLAAAGNSGESYWIASSSLNNSGEYTTDTFKVNSQDEVYALRNDRIFVLDTNGDQTSEGAITYSYTTAYWGMALTSADDLYMCATIYDSTDYSAFTISVDPSTFSENWEKKDKRTGYSSYAIGMTTVGTDVYVTGDTYASDVAGTDHLLVKYNSSGTRLAQGTVRNNGGNNFRAYTALYAGGYIWTFGLQKSSTPRISLVRWTRSCNGSAEYTLTHSTNSTVNQSVDHCFACIDKSSSSYMYALYRGYIGSQFVALVLKLNTGDGSVQWAKSISLGSDNLFPSGIDCDSEGNIAIQCRRGSSAISVIKLDSSGSLAWGADVDYLGAADEPFGLAIDSKDNILFGCQLNSRDTIVKIAGDGSVLGSYGNYSITSTSPSVTDETSSFTKAGYSLTTDSVLTSSSGSSFSSGSTSSTMTNVTVL